MTDEPDELPPDMLASLRATPTVARATSDAHIERALSLFDSLPGPGQPPADEATITALRRRPRAARWIAVAAAIVVAVTGVWLVARGSSPTGVQTADRATQSQSRAQSRAQSQALSPAASPTGATSSRTPAPPPPSPVAQSKSADSPAFGSAITREPAESSAATAPTATTPAGPGPLCRAPRLRAALLTIRTTTIHGRTRLVYTYVSGPRGEITTTVVVDPSTCARD